MPSVDTSRVDADRARTFENVGAWSMPVDDKGLTVPAFGPSMSFRCIGALGCLAAFGDHLYAGDSVDGLLLPRTVWQESAMHTDGFLLFKVDVGRQLLQIVPVFAMQLLNCREMFSRAMCRRRSPGSTV